MVLSVVDALVTLSYVPGMYPQYDMVEMLRTGIL